MINGIKKETIASTTEDRLTLLNWLKKLEKTLSDDMIADIAFTDDGGNVSLVLTFEDGTTKSVAFPYDMIAFANKSEVTSGLALKADVAGQAFTGPITAPSIIQDTRGFVLQSASLASGAFISVCQNGNKLTFVFSGTLTIDTGRTITELAVFNIPASIGAKLIPNIDGNRILLNDVIVAAGRATQRYTLAFFVTKWNDTSITFYLNLLDNPPVPYVNGDYIVRAEATFLLSDNLAS